MPDTDSVASGAKPKPKGSKCGDCASFVTKAKYVKHGIMLNVKKYKMIHTSF